MHLLKKYNSTAVYHYGAYLAIFVSSLFIIITLGYIRGLWSFLIITGIFAIVFGMMAPLGMKTSLTAFRSVSGMAAAMQSSTLFAASALGSASVGMLMYHFERSVSVESIFSLISAVLCLLAAVAALKSKKLLLLSTD